METEIPGLQLTRYLVGSSHRRLPHVYCLHQPLFLTFRLSGSLPVGRVFPREALTSGQAFLAMDRLLDGGRFGLAHLQHTPIATLVRDSIQHCGRMDYDLHAWVIMPNHVHMLITPLTEVSPLLRRLKGFSARQANKLLGTAGRWFWQEESYDHLVRTSLEFRNIERYIVMNPVKAGFARSAEAFPWSSAAPVGEPAKRVWRPAADLEVRPTCAIDSVGNVQDSSGFFDPHP